MLRGFGVGKLLEHEGKRSNEKRAKPRAKIKIEKQNGEADDELEEAVHELKAAVDDLEASKSELVPAVDLSAAIADLAALNAKSSQMAKDVDFQSKKITSKIF